MKKDILTGLLSVSEIADARWRNFASLAKASNNFIFTMCASAYYTDGQLADNLV